MSLKICVIGGGRWGENHIRTLDEMGYLGAVLDNNKIRIENLKKKFNTLYLENIEEAIKKKFDGYIVATPAETHYKIAKELIINKCNLIVEKPLTLDSKTSYELVNLSKKYQITFMVGHLLLFHPAIIKIKELIKNGEIGNINFINSKRVNYGKVRSYENVFWSFAAHDISVINYLINDVPEKVNAFGGNYLQNGIEDFVNAGLYFKNNIKANIFVSWMNPFKEQKFTIVGTEGMIVFDDASTEKNIVLSRKTFKKENGHYCNIDSGDYIIEYKKLSPLKCEIEYFLSILGNKAEISNGLCGYDVVKCLEEVDINLKM